jgi:predicted nucleic acid-binding Zn ribbon protein
MRNMNDRKRYNKSSLKNSRKGASPAERAGLVEKRKRSKKNELSFLGDTLSAVYATKKWRHQWRVFRLAQDWPAIVGVEVARLTAPAFFRQDVLWIFVQDSAWMQHMQFIKLDLLTRVNQALAEPPIIDIRWLLQPATLPQPKRHVPESHPVDPRQEQSFRQLTESVANQECREALQRLWQIFASNTE